MRQFVHSNQEIEHVVETYSDTLLRLAMHHVSDIAQAQDIVQDVFIKYIKSNKDFIDIEHEKAWLLRVTINTCNDYHKHWWQKKRSPFPINASTNKQNDSNILEEIKKLSKNQRNAIYLFYYEEMSTKEIASLFKVKEGTVSSWITRGRQKLKTILEQGGWHDR